MSIAMTRGRCITDFLRSRVGNLGVSSLVLVVLEEMMDHDFVCPCQDVLNKLICTCYALVPSFACCAFTLCFVDMEAKGPQDKGNHSKYIQVLYYSLIACIWLFIFFIDGRYVSCACSHWGGKYTETGALKWCKPNGSETVVFESLQETHKCIAISQFVGFSIAFVISVLLLILYYCCRDCVQQNRDIPMLTRN